VSLSGTTAVVGAPNKATPAAFAGAVYVYERSPGGYGAAAAWREQRRLALSDGAGRDHFGYSVAVSANTVLAGAPFDDTSTDDHEDTGSVGVFPASDPLYTPLPPARILDTRPGLLDADGFNVALAPGTSIDVPVTGVGGVPAGGVAAVAVNVTATQPSQAGHLTVWPTGETRPTASNLNFDPGEDVANLAVAKVGAGGRVSVYNGSAGATHVILDVNGWFASES
jgi:hypothetical protein